MNHLSRTSRTLLVASTLLMLLACQGPLATPDHSPGRLTLTWSLGPQARTLLPQSYPELATYNVWLTPNIGETKAQIGITTTSWTVSDLDASTYAVLVEGCDTEGRVIASGTGSANVTSGPASVPVQLSYVINGFGTGEIHLSVTVSDVTVTGANLRLTDPSGVVSSHLLAGGPTTYTYTNTSASVGTYKLYISLLGAQTANRFETLLVARNVNTEATVSFSASDFHEAAAIATTSTFAGMDSNGTIDGSAGVARLNGPGDMVSVGTNLYFTEDTTIRKLDLETGAVLTIAGSVGLLGSTDGVGTSAQFSYPRGLATDGTNLYIADHGNHTIRKLDITTGEVSTLAGVAGSSGVDDGTGETARFKSPTGVALIGTSLYVTDRENHAIRNVDISTGTVTTLAGWLGASGSGDGVGINARFDNPSGLATDGINLFVTDIGNNTIRQVAIATGAVTTLAGGPNLAGTSDGVGNAARFGTPMGVATDGTSLYVSDTDNKTIRKVLIATGEVSTLVGAAGVTGSLDGSGSAASFGLPRGVIVNGAFLYVGDAGNNTIRRVEIATGEVSTSAGVAPGIADNVGTAARFRAPGGITSDTTSLYVVDTDNHTIRKVVIATGEVTTLAGSPGVSGIGDGSGISALFNRPTDIVSDGTFLFVADAGNSTIRKVEIATGAVTTLAGTPGVRGSVDGTGGSALFDSPVGITTDGTSVFVADYARCVIRKIDIATTVVSTIAGLAGEAGNADGVGSSARFFFPNKIATDGTSLYVTDRAYYSVRRISIASQEVTTLAGTAESSGHVDGPGPTALFSGPQGLATDGTNLYLTDSNCIRYIDIATGEVTTLAGLPWLGGASDGPGEASRFAFPQGITVAGSKLFVADTNNNTVRMIR